MPTERPPLVGEVVLTFADRGCCVVSATDPPVVSLGFLDRSQRKKTEENPDQTEILTGVHNINFELFTTVAVERV
jgi:hypothetical protein